MYQIKLRKVAIKFFEYPPKYVKDESSKKTGVELILTVIICPINSSKCK